MNYNVTGDGEKMEATLREKRNTFSPYKSLSESNDLDTIYMLK